MENSNTRYIETLVRFSKGDKLMAFDENRAQKFQQSKQTVHNYNTSKNNTSAKLQQISPIEKATKYGIKEIIPANYSTNGRSLTLKQLKDTI